jgi:AcrR family transcriptional regulator
MAADADRIAAVRAAFRPVPGQGPAAEPPCGGPQPQRRRGETLEKAIFGAVVDLLRVDGYAGLTMERVATCAHTGKAALYRRWPHKDDLIVDAINHLLPSMDDLPDQGSVRDELLSLLRRMAELMSSPVGCAFQNLMTEIERNDAFARLLQERVKVPLKRLWLRVLQRAADRGEIRTDAVTQLIADVGPSMLAQYCLTEGSAIPDAFVVSVLDDVVMPLLAAKTGTSGAAPATTVQSAAAPST